MHAATQASYDAHNSNASKRMLPSTINLHMHSGQASWLPVLAKLRTQPTCLATCSSRNEPSSRSRCTSRMNRGRTTHDERWTIPGKPDHLCFSTLYECFLRVFP